MGVYRPEKTTLIQEIKTLKHKVPAAYDEKTFRSVLSPFSHLQSADGLAG
jgi:hypothetical protein